MKFKKCMHSVLFFLVVCSYASAIQGFFDGVFDDAKNYLFGSKLFKALEANSLHQVKQALKDGVNINEYNSEGATPLNYAIINNKDVKIVTYLIKQPKIEINKKNKDVRVKQKLYGAGVTYEMQNRVTKKGLEPIIYALSRKNTKERLEIVKFLLSKKDINLDVKNAKGEGLVHLAIKNNDTVIVQLLLKRNPKIVNNKAWQGMVPLHYAVNNNNLFIIELLFKYNTDIVIDAQDDNMLTPLMYAAKKGYVNVCKMLLDQGAKVNESDKRYRQKAGSTALMYAAQEGHADVCRLLLNRGANPEIKNADGKTAYDLAKNDQIKKILYCHPEDECRRKIINR